MRSYHEEEYKGDIESMNSSCDRAFLEYKAVAVGLGSDVVEGRSFSSCCDNINDDFLCCWFAVFLIFVDESPSQPPVDDVSAVVMPSSISDIATNRATPRLVPSALSSSRTT